MLSTTTLNSMARVVIAVHDEITRLMLCENLEVDRFNAVPAAGIEELALACEAGADVVVVDARFDRGLAQLRELVPPPQVIVVGGSGAGEIARAISLGADDYLARPFQYCELLTRIRVLLDRQDALRGGSDRFEVDGLVVDVRTRVVAVDGRRVSLSAKEFDLLRHLVIDPARVFTKQELLRDVWGYRAAGRTRTLDSHASRLRRKLDPQRGRFVINCWGVGYRLCAG